MPLPQRAAVIAAMEVQAVFELLVARGVPPRWGYQSMFDPGGGQSMLQWRLP